MDRIKRAPESISRKVIGFAIGVVAMLIILGLGYVIFESPQAGRIKSGSLPGTLTSTIK